MSQDLWEDEIRDLHDFFEAWLGGALDAPPLSRAAAAFAEQMTFIGPDGEAIGRERLLAGLAQARGAREGLRIEITDPVLHMKHHGTILATYCEHQHDGEQTTVRRSTVVFEEDAAAPLGLVWRHVHETWVQPPSDG